MKHITCLCLSAVLLTAPLTACGRTPEPVDSAELLQHLQFYGTEFAFPCTYGEISDRFGLEDGYYYETAGYTYYNLTYDGKKVADIAFSGDITEENEDREIELFVVNDQQAAELTIGDTDAGTSYRSLVKAFGKPDYETKASSGSRIVTYNWDGVDLSVLFHDSEAYEYTFVKR